MRTIQACVAIIALLAPAMPKDSQVTIAAKDFLALLSAEQRAKTVFSIGSSFKTSWMFVPGDRKGVSWGEMTPAQKTAGKKLLQSALSTEGYVKVEAIRELENVLRELENGNLGRDPNRYWFVFFGEPSSKSPWVWRYEGHHLSLTFGNQKGTVVSSTPQFLGTNPAEVPRGAMKGTRVLAKEQDLAYILLGSLSDSQKSQAVIASDAPNDIVTGASRVASIQDQSGLDVKLLSQSQHKMFEDLLKAHASVQSKPEQKRRMEAIRKDPKVVFAWMGSTQKGAKHYYRIQGKSFLIEYDNTQNDANHIHSVWRNFDEDFGGELKDDTLGRHLSNGHHH